jgi:DNA polymerase III epsilon subunit-like protein
MAEAAADLSGRIPPARVETFVSVDIEAAGPTPGVYSLLSIGACLVDDPTHGFYVELKPTTTAVVPSAQAIGGLSLDDLADRGVDPAEAMQRLETWLAEEVPEGAVPVFVGFNASFDWMFVADYFERFLGRNPFGHAAIDIKSYFMGMTGVTWAQTSMRFLAPRYLDGRKLSHNALGDARDQAKLFRAMRFEADRNQAPGV